MPKQKQYRVMWEIDVWDETPLQAARQALAIQRDPGSTATVFDVYGPTGRHTHVDTELVATTKKERKA